MNDPHIHSNHINSAPVEPRSNSGGTPVGDTAKIVALNLSGSFLK